MKCRILRKSCIDMQWCLRYLKHHPNYLIPLRLVWHLNRWRTRLRVYLGWGSMESVCDIKIQSSSTGKQSLTPGRWESLLTPSQARRGENKSPNNSYMYFRFLNSWIIHCRSKPFSLFFFFVCFLMAYSWVAVPKLLLLKHLSYVLFCNQLLSCTCK